MENRVVIKYAFERTWKTFLKSLYLVALTSAPSIHPSLLHLSFIYFPSISSSLPVWSLICGGPPGEEVSFPAAAPWAGLTRRLESESKEDRLQSHMLRPINLRLQHRPQLLDLRRGDPASRCHPSQVTYERITSESQLQIYVQCTALDHFHCWRQAQFHHFSTVLAYFVFYDPCEENVTFWGNEDTQFYSQHRWGLANGFQLMHIILPKQ